MTSNLNGVIVPAITPLNADGKLNRPAFLKLLHSLTKAGVSGIFVGGSAGQGPMLLEETWNELMAIAFEQLNGKCHLMAGVIETSTLRAVQKIRILEAIGYKYIVITPTFYIRLERTEEFLRHFGACRDSFSGEIIAYNIPSCTYSMIPLEIVSEMGRRKWISGFKESSGDRNYFTGTLAAAKNFCFSIFQGNEADIAWALKLGADGIVPVCANFDPELYIRACAVAHQDDFLALDAIQRGIDRNKAEYVIGDGSVNWIVGITRQTATRVGLDSAIVLTPLEDNSVKAIN